jgi:hypothetical protein
MPFYAHRENITILWNSISNSSAFKDFNYPNDKYIWFNNIVDEFSQNNTRNLSADNLNEINCMTIKRMFDKITEYQRNDNRFTFPSRDQMRYDNSLESESPIPQRNFTESQFDQRMREYDSMMNPSPPSPISFNLPKDKTSSDLDELMSRRLKDREMELNSREMELNSNTQTNTIQNSLTDKMWNINNTKKTPTLSIDSSFGNIPLMDIEYVVEPRTENDFKSKNISWETRDNSEGYLQYIKESNARSDTIIRNTEFIMSKLEKIERMLQIRETTHDETETETEFPKFSITLPTDTETHHLL